MDGKIRKLRGSNMDIDFSCADFGDAQCPWNQAEHTEEHRCAVKNTSICPYFCGVQYLDSVLCSYPHKTLDVLSQEEIDRDMGEIQD